MSFIWLVMFKWNNALRVGFRRVWWKDPYLGLVLALLLLRATFTWVSNSEIKGGLLKFEMSFFACVLCAFATLVHGNRLIKLGEHASLFSRQSGIALRQLASSVQIHRLGHIAGNELRVLAADLKLAEVQFAPASRERNRASLKFDAAYRAFVELGLIEDTGYGQYFQRRNTTI